MRLDVEHKNLALTCKSRPAPEKFPATRKRFGDKSKFLVLNRFAPAESTELQLELASVCVILSSKRDFRPKSEMRPRCAAKYDRKMQIIPRNRVLSAAQISPRLQLAAKSAGKVRRPALEALIVVTLIGIYFQNIARPLVTIFWGAEER